MPITFYCPRCNKMLRAPDAAAGKSSAVSGLRCHDDVSGAGVRGRGRPCLAEEITGSTVSPRTNPPPRESPAQKPPPVNPYVDLDDDQPYALASSAGRPPRARMESRRPCPACGEMILSSAVKCRFCGEVFDRGAQEGRRWPRSNQPKKASSRTQAADGRDLVIGFLCFAVGSGLTLASYANAASSNGGSRYFVFYGLIIGGIAGMIRGMAGLARSSR